MREWWIRTLLVVQAPRPVFVALRDESKESVADRSEPVLAIVLLAGIAYALATPAASTLMEDRDYDALLVAVWAFLGGAAVGAFAYWAFGAVLYGSVRLLGSRGSFRRARHVLAFAWVPIVLSLALWPVKLALYGEDWFRDGGSDTGAVADAFRVLDFAFLAWAVALLVLGIRAVHGWTWPRAAAASTLAIAATAVMVGAPSALNALAGWFA
ncbi:MAG TPA: Yip1 family protein [Planctomycetota bacterium]|nr:Yip1 family protein [Planctomycetota bacterium]